MKNTPHYTQSKPLDTKEMFLTNLSKIMEVKGWNWGDLAKASGINRMTISKYDNGKTKNASLDTLERIARAVGFELYEMIAGTLMTMYIEQKLYGNNIFYKGEE